MARSVLGLSPATSLSGAAPLVLFVGLSGALGCYVSENAHGPVPLEQSVMLAAKEVPFGSPGKEKPIIAISRFDGLLDRLKARLAGADAYVTKPFTVMEILATIEHCVSGISRSSK